MALPDSARMPMILTHTSVSIFLIIPKNIQVILKYLVTRINTQAIPNVYNPLNKNIFAHIISTEAVN